MVNLNRISECVKTVSCPGECHERCGVDIISDTVDGNIVQAVQGDTQLITSMNITQEFGMPEDFGL